MRDIDTIVIHCSATKHTRTDLNWVPAHLNRVPAHLDRAFIRKIHVEENGWSDIGYHWIITRSGTVQKARPVTQTGAHARGHNKTSIGICLMGGLYDNGLPSEGIGHFSIEQQLALAWMIDQSKHHFPITRVVGHRDLPDVKKACPCFSVEAFMRTLPAIVAKLEFSEYVPALQA